MNGRPAFSRAFLGLLCAVAIGAGVVFGAMAATMNSSGSSSPSATGSDAAGGSPTLTASPTRGPSPTPAPTAGPTPSPTPEPTPTLEPTPKLVPAPLTGRMVTEGVARRHVMAVMIDDHWDARPQSGFTNASIVWHAPAEGGIPRYMALYQEQLAPAIGPVRSARYYYVGWAAEWNALYVHVGGSPQALAFLRSNAGKRAVYDADEYRWGGRAGLLWRIRERFPPHNVYTDSRHLRHVARRVGAKDGDIEPAWRFGPDANLVDRPKGGVIVVPYRHNRIVYRYDRAGNRYLRAVTDEAKQIDGKTRKRVGPKNVVILLMRFGPLNDGSPKDRLEADFIGSGTAYIATNGKTIKGTWRKESLRAPTLLYGPDGRPVTLTVGQTFVQVVETGTKLTIRDGTVPPPPAPEPGVADRRW